MGRKLKILLINPPADNATVTTVGWKLIAEDIGAFPPISLMYIAASLMKSSRHEVVLVDSVFERLTINDVARKVYNFMPDLVGITSFTPIFYDVMEVAKAVKAINSKIHVSLGGAHTNVYPFETIEKPEIDSIVLGEGEYIFPALADALASNDDLNKVKGLVIKTRDGIVKTGEPGYIEDLDKLPFPNFELLPYRKYFSAIGSGKPVGTICSSRGCPHSCSFCCKPHKTYRMRSPANVVDEMKLYYDRGIDEFFFFDDMFNVTAKRVISISEEILLSGMRTTWSFRGRVDAVSRDMLSIAKKAGCKQILFGVEAATDEGLKAIKKGITIDQAKTAVKLTREAGIESSTNWIIGFPHDKSKKDVDRLIKFACKLNSDYAQFNVLVPYDRTEIFEQGVQKGVLNKNFWRDYVRDPEPRKLVPIWDEYMTRSELSRHLRRCYRKFYFRPGKIIRNLLSIKDLNYFRNRMRGFIALLGFGGYIKRTLSKCLLSCKT